MKRFLWTLVAATAGPVGLWAQLSAPNPAGVAMGHLHYHVQDVEANRDFWLRLGGEPARVGTTRIVKFPDVLVFLDEADSTGGTEGSVVNHVAFRVRSLDDIEAAGLEVEHLADFPGVGSVFTPEGERIELFDESAVNLTFVEDSGGADPVAQRHNRPITVPIIAHHIHLYLPEGAEEEAKAWYTRVFGGVPGMRWRYPATDLPGINFNFSSAVDGSAPLKGRMLDHIGFEVVNLEAFCEQLEAQGVRFDIPYTRDPSGIASAFLTDPWGTYIELTEGLNQF